MTTEFDMTVIGGGAAGLVAAQVSAFIGARTALIESHRLGGDCTWTGCIPSKALLAAGAVAQSMRTAGRFGIGAREPEVDFRAVMRRVHSIRQNVYATDDSPEVLERHGIRMFPARARFADPHTIELSTGQRITSRYFVIAAGGRPLLPKIEGLDRVTYLTSESLFEMDRLPRRLIVVGGGPTGVEMAQAFARLGSKVTLLETCHRLLSRDDAELTYLLEQSLRDEGIDIRFGAAIEKIEGNVTATLAGGTRIESDAILFATGRCVDVSDLNLKAAGIRVTEYGVSVDPHCRTAVKHIYASGEVTGRYQLTHMAEHMSRIAVQNALLGTRAKIEDPFATWCTFSDPELAHVGASEDQVKNRNIRYDVYKFPYARIDRAVTDGRSGLIKIFATPRKGRVLGAAILGAHAGEMIAEFAIAMRRGLTLRDLKSVIHVYPTYMFGVRRAADQWMSSGRGMRALWAVRSVFF